MSQGRRTSWRVQGVSERRPWDIFLPRGQRGAKAKLGAAALAAYMVMGVIG